MKNGFTTTILHSDLESPIEHFAVHKPMHTSVAYGYADARDLAKVFKGELPGYVYGRQGNPTTAALEDENHQDGGRRRDRLLRHRHGRNRRQCSSLCCARAITSYRARFCSATPTACSAL